MTKLSEEMDEEAKAIVEYSDSGVDYAVSITLKKYLPKVKELEEENARLKAEINNLEDEKDDMRAEMAEAADMAELRSDLD